MVQLDANLLCFDIPTAQFSLPTHYLRGSPLEVTAPGSSVNLISSRQALAFSNSLSNSLRLGQASFLQAKHPFDFFSPNQTSMVSVTSALACTFALCVGVTTGAAGSTRVPDIVDAVADSTAVTRATGDRSTRSVRTATAEERDVQPIAVSYTTQWTPIHH